MNDLIAALDKYDRECRLPDSIPEMMSWFPRREAARAEAEAELEKLFSHEQLKSIAYLTVSMFPEAAGDGACIDNDTDCINHGISL